MMPSVAKYAELSPDGKSLTVHLPLTLRKRGGRKIIISPARRTAMDPSTATHRQHSDPGAGAGVPLETYAGNGRVRLSDRTCRGRKA